MNFSPLITYVLRYCIISLSVYYMDMGLIPLSKKSLNSSQFLSNLCDLLLCCCVFVNNWSFNLYDNGDNLCKDSSPSWIEQFSLTLTPPSAPSRQSCSAEGQKTPKSKAVFVKVMCWGRDTHLAHSEQVKVTLCGDLNDTEWQRLACRRVQTCTQDVLLL